MSTTTTTTNSNGDHLTRVPLEVLYIISADLSVADLSSLSQTSHHFRSLYPELAKHDIKQKSYNSVYWACYTDDTALMDLALTKGANPNAVFCRDYQGDNRAWDELFYDDDVTVFPSITVYGTQLVEGPGCSILAKATQFNALDVMRMLLERGAATQEVHEVPVPTPDRFGNPMDEFPRLSALSYVISLEAAQLLIQYGAASGINARGFMKLAPLEIIMYKAVRVPLHLRIREAELAQIVRLFLQHGANPLGSRNANIMPWNLQDRRQSAPLLAAIYLQSIPCFRAISQAANFPLDSQAPEYLFALNMIFKGEKLFEHGPDEENDDFCCRMLEVVVQCQTRSDAQMRELLTLAIENERGHLIPTLIRHGADPNRMWETVPTAISEFIVHMISKENRSDPYESSKSASNMLTTLVNSGADVNAPSFTPDGPTPLALACIGKVPASVFEHLLTLDATIPALVKMTPASQPTTLVQAIMGLGLPTFEQASQWFIEEAADILSDDTNKSCSSRRFKLHTLAEEANARELFRVGDQHIIAWALQSLGTRHLHTSLIPLLDTYYLTYTPGDIPPAWVYASPSRIKTHLAFGTLTNEAENISALILHSPLRNPSLDCTDTLLHRISLLQPHLGSRRSWTTITSRLGKDCFAYSPHFLQVLDWNTQPTIRDCPWTTLKLHEFRYVQARRRGIVLMIRTLLMASEVQMNALNGDGKTALDLVRDPEIRRVMRGLGCRRAKELEREAAVPVVYFF